MYKFSLLLTLFFTTLFARENPFFPVNPSQDVAITTNQVETFPPLKRASITLPSTARVLESVTLKYKNLDGSIESKTLELHNSIDWHLPLFISQNYSMQECQTATSVKVKKKKVRSRFHEVAKLAFIRFYVDHKKMKIVTKDKLLRHFLLVKPHRIVCDFARDTDIRSYDVTTPKGTLFKKIRIGTHKGYYRVVIELDGYYAYSIKKEKGMYLISLH
jgi:hypothetical protein